MNRDRDKQIYIKIQESMQLLDEIDGMIDSQSNELQEIDYKISDILHYLENNEVNDKECVKIVQLLQEFRRIRRSLHKEHEIEKTYKENSGKVMGNNTRGMLLAEINKTIKQLTSEYKYRIITEDEIKLLINDKKKVGRPRKKEENEL